MPLGVANKYAQQISQPNPFEDIMRIALGQAKNINPSALQALLRSIGY